MAARTASFGLVAHSTRILHFYRLFVSAPEPCRRLSVSSALLLLCLSCSRSGVTQYNLLSRIARCVISVALSCASNCLSRDRTLSVLNVKKRGGMWEVGWCVHRTALYIVHVACCTCTLLALRPQRHSLSNRSAPGMLLVERVCARQQDCARPLALHRGVVCRQVDHSCAIVRWVQGVGLSAYREAERLGKFDRAGCDTVDKLNVPLI